MPTTPEQFAHHVARELLARPWTRPAIAAVLHAMCLPSARGLDRLARAVFARFAAAPRLRPLRDYLARRRRLLPYALPLAEQPRPTMLPLPGAPRPAALPSLVTPSDLAAWLGIDLDRLLAWTRRFHPDAERRSPRLLHYHRRWIARRSGPPRLIEAPKPALKRVQQRLLHDLLDHVPAHPAAHGFVPGRGIRTFTGPHCRTACVLRLDLRDFFASITQRRVRAVFSTLGYPVDVAQQLAVLATVPTPLPQLRALQAAGAEGAALHARLQAPHLPQGAPSSPALANLVAFRLDARLDGLARRFGACYTRYADDLLFSGDAAFARGSTRCAAWVARIVMQEGFSVASNKTRCMRQGTRQHAGGRVLNVHAAMPRAERDRLEAQLHNCTQHGPSTQNRSGVDDLRANLRGRIGHVRHCHAPHAVRLQALFDRIDWSR